MQIPSSKIILIIKHNATTTLYNKTALVGRGNINDNNKDNFNHKNSIN